MKKLMFIIAMLFGFSFAAQSAIYTVDDWTNFNANGVYPVEDYDNHGGEFVDVLEDTDDFIRWTHHFEFEPELGTILSAVLTLDFCDTACQQCEGECDSDIARLVNVVPGDNNILQGNWEVESGEVPFVIEEFESLVDGSFTLKLSSNDDGCYELNSSHLQIEYSVPEPAALGLLAVGLMGFGLSRRRRS